MKYVDVVISNRIPFCQKRAYQSDRSDCKDLMASETFRRRKNRRNRSSQNDEVLRDTLYTPFRKAFRGREARTFFPGEETTALILLAVREQNDRNDPRTRGNVEGERICGARLMVRRSMNPLLLTPLPSPIPRPIISQTPLLFGRGRTTSSGYSTEVVPVRPHLPGVPRIRI